MSSTFETGFSNGDLIEPAHVSQFAQPVNDLESGYALYREAVNASGVYQVDFQPSANPDGHFIEALSAGQGIVFKASHNSPADAELEVLMDGGSETHPLYLGGAPVGAGDIVAGQIMMIVYNDTTTPRFDIIGGGGLMALDDLTDVELDTPATGQVLRYDGTEFVNATLEIDDVDGLSAAIATAGGTVGGNLADLQGLTLVEGDLLTVDDGGDLVRLPVGDEGYVLKIVDGVPAWGEDLGGGGRDGTYAAPFILDNGTDFGTGADGAITYSSNTTLTSDVNATNVTVNNSIVVTLGWNSSAGRPARIYCTGTLHLSNASSRIQTDGVIGGTGTGHGSTHTPVGTAGAGGSAGGLGSSSSSNAGGNASTLTGPSIGGKGGTGAAGYNHASVGSTWTAGGSGGGGSQDIVYLTTLEEMLTGIHDSAQLMGGSGGGGGGHTYRADNTTQYYGGAGGGGGGLTHVFAKNITGLGQIRSLGGDNRVSGGNTSYGRGAAGGGGGVIVVCRTIAEAVQLSTAPGVFSAGSAHQPATPGTHGQIYLLSEYPIRPENTTGYFMPFWVAPVV